MIPTNEQPYPLPNDWQWVKMKNIATLFTGNSINEKIKTEKYLGKADGLIYIATKDIGFDNQIDYATNIRIPASDNFKIAPTNTPLLCIEGGSAGRKLGFTNQPVCFVNKLCAFVSNKANPKLIYYFLQTQDFAEQFTAMKHGLIGGVSIKNLMAVNFPLPPLNEQQRIVSLLDELFSKLDETKALAQSVVDGSELRNTAILHKAFTGELTKLWRDEHGITLDSWQRCLLGSVLISSKKKTADFSSSDLKYVGLENMEKDGGQISFQKVDKVRSTKNIFHVGDLLYGKLRPYLNKHGVATLDGVCSTDILVFKASAQAEIEFINYFLSLPKFIEYAVANSKGINLPRVSEKIVLDTEIFLPPLAEQKEIVRLLDDLLSREQRTKYIATKTLERIDLLKKSILARAFRGELRNSFNKQEKSC